MAQCKCNLIIDSCCDLPVGVVDREGVTLVQFPYLLDGVNRFDDLYQSTDAHAFYDAMRAGSFPSTAQVPLYVLQEVFEYAAKSGVPTVYLSFSSGLSGTFNTVLMVRDQVLAEYPDAELHVVDTRLASVAEGLLVYEALRQREKGLSAKDLASWAEEARYFVHGYFMVDDLESLRRGGRIPSTVALAGSKLDVKPMLSFDLEGKLSLIGVVRGRKKGLKQLAEYYQKNREEVGCDRFVVVADADCPKDLAKLKTAVAKVDEQTVFMETSIGPVIGSHVGPDMVAVVFWGKDRRADLSVADRIARRVRGED